MDSKALLLVNPENINGIRLYRCETQTERMEIGDTNALKMLSAYESTN